MRVVGWRDSMIHMIHRIHLIQAFGICDRLALIDTENICRILIRVVGWRDSLYATHAALACFTFPILSTRP